MCLGLPGRVVSIEAGTTVGRVDVAGVVRAIDLGLLDPPARPGEHVLVHSGIALERMTPDRAREAENLLSATGRSADPE